MLCTHVPSNRLYERRYSNRRQICIPGVTVVSHSRDLCFQLVRGHNLAVWWLTDCRSTGSGLTTPPVVCARIGDHLSIIPYSCLCFGILTIQRPKEKSWCTHKPTRIRVTVIFRRINVFIRHCRLLYSSRFQKGPSTCFFFLQTTRNSL